MRYAWIVVAGLVVGVWSTNGWAETATATIEATTEGSAVAGTATLTDSPHGLQVAIQVSGLAPGKYAMHIHQYGACGNAGADAGGHFNPYNAPHGFLPKDGPAKAHPGDMGNIEVGEDGSGSLALTLINAALTGSLPIVAGRAIVLHEKSDDFSQPTGNAGGRIGCGPIVLVKPGEGG